MTNHNDLLIVTGLLQGGDDDASVPMFLTEFVLDTSHLRFDPDEDEVQEALLDVIHAYQDTVLKVQNLVADNYFDAFTRQVNVNNGIYLLSRFKARQQIDFEK